MSENGSEKLDGVDSNSVIDFLRFEEKTQIVIRFKDSIRFETPISRENYVQNSFKNDVLSIERKYGTLNIEPIFDEPKINRISHATQQAIQKDRNYKPANFSTFFKLTQFDTTRQKELVDDLLSLPVIESAYLGHTGPDPKVYPDNDPRFASQGYLDPAPYGVNAEYAWKFAGGDGEGQRFIDLERGWTLNHEDIEFPSASLLHGTINKESRAHGTSVLGAICAADNAVGCVGIAPHVQSFDVVSFYGSSIPDAILTALEHLSFGDVLLFEAQVWVDDKMLLGPVEYDDLNYELIRLCTAMGIIVVEAGGNGTNNGSAPALDMDTYETPDLKKKQRFNPLSPDFRDSGAIIVSAATSRAPHQRLLYGPYGKRIDCYAWGANIDTLSSDKFGATNAYNARFGGTSGASAIITGCVLSIQGLAEAQLGYRFSPHQMRAILRDPDNGTLPALNETTSFGIMPDLKKIIDKVLNVSPNLYIRDFVGDTGSPHMSAFSTSPDIIVSTDLVPDPQLIYGEESGTENSDMMGIRVVKDKTK